MNQTSAAILVLASSVFSYAAVNTTSTQTTYPFLALVSVGIGLWGILALIGGILREREMFVDNHARLDVFDRLFARDTNRAPVRTRDRNIELSPEVQAQLNVTAELEGRDRSEVVEETLRRHLPKYTKSRVA
ncbi:MAG: hypothetical protein KDB27_29280 [Planctomycetales bacterium]|nr:hypothetical protein [Planctomycetales bacterium]